MSSCVLTLYLWTSHDLKKCWSATSSYATVKFFWPSFWPKIEHWRCTELLALNKIHLVGAVRVFTGHCTISIHAVRLKILSDANRQSCMEEDVVETSRHFLLHCTEFARLRLKCLRNHTFKESGELSEIDISRLNKSDQEDHKWDQRTSAFNCSNEIRGGFLSQGLAYLPMAY